MFAPAVFCDALLLKCGLSLLSHTTRVIVIGLNENTKVMNTHQSELITLMIARTTKTMNCHEPVFPS
jgi:hypothetical protein